MKRNWRCTLGQHLRHMTHAQVAASLRRIRVRGPIRSVLVEQPEVRKLTGGIDGPKVNQYVVGKLLNKLRALAPTTRQFDPTDQHD